MSSEVIDLIDETKRHCFLVSPYVYVWPNLARTLERARDRGTRISVFLRADQNDGVEGLANELNKNFGMEVHLVPFLHTKLFVNERTGILGSMNLYDASQERNLELAVKVKGARECEGLIRDFILGEILPAATRSISGVFADAVAKDDDRRAELATMIGELGYCVTCGRRTALDMSRVPRLVRCKHDWLQDPDAAEVDYRIHHCHLCGGKHEATLATPLHESCLSKLREYLDLSWTKPG